MKISLPLTAMVALLLWLQPAGAQQAIPINTPDYNKPKIFADLPQQLAVDITRWEGLLRLQKGATVSSAIADGLALDGTVMSRFVAADSSLQTVVIKAASRQNAVFSFSRVRNADGSFSYRGQILTATASDALELVAENGTWLLRKRSYYDVVSE